MRARDFITEIKGYRSKLEKGKKPHTHVAANPGSVQGKGYYDLYRASMAMAGMDKDGNNENMPDPESWMGNDGYVVAYTEGGEGRSKELDAVNKTSPVKGFRGYPR